jgi:tRNA nucleotidyltransferase/poly(A) polymerase
VGGAVRDILLGVTPHDIDLATTATNDEIINMIQRDSNIKLIYTRAEQFGTLTLVVGTTLQVDDFLFYSIHSYSFKNIYV